MVSKRWNVVYIRNIEFTSDIALVRRYSLLGDGANTMINLCEDIFMVGTLTVLEGSCDGVICVLQFDISCFNLSTI
jgi:hypothetical protein